MLCTCVLCVRAYIVCLCVCVYVGRLCKGNPSVVASRRDGCIPANSVLIFDVELISIA